MIVKILMVIALVLLVMSLCTLFTTSRKGRLFNSVVNTVLMAVMMTKDLIVGNYGWAGLFAALFILDIVFLFLVSRWDKKENPWNKFDDLLERDKFLNDIKKKYGGTRH